MCRPVLILLSIVAVVVMAKEIPDTFLARWVLERSENFDEYLASKGVNWFLRKMIGFSSITKVFAKGDQPGTYNLENLSSKKNAIHKNWKLGETFQDIGFDDKKHNITFDYDGNELTEKHVRLDDPNDKGETYHYTVENSYLVLRMQNEQVTCRRFFKKDEKKN